MLLVNNSLSGRWLFLASRLTIVSFDVHYIMMCYCVYNVTVIKVVLGMINFPASHIPSMLVTMAPPRDLLKTDVHFQWDLQHNAALIKIKEVLSSAPVLNYFDPSKTSTIQADASQHGIGACLLQGKPVAYAFRSLSPS